VGRMDEVIPTSPAAAHGRVIVGTALGMIAALDAYDGRIRWIYRYDRAVETERGVRRNRNRPDVGQRASSFANEPPILAEARCYVAPTDSNKLLILHDRPLGAGRSLLGEDRSRMIVAWFFMAEHIAGVAPARDGTGPQLVVVGKGEDSSPPGPLVTAVDALLRTPPWPDEKERALRVEEKQSWSGVSPTGFGPEPYGRALVTAEEVFVPTWHGIAIYELADRDGNGTHYLGVLNRQAMLHPEPVPEDLTPYGNLIPVPGRGIAAVSATTVAFWGRR
jgi:hypothetical protein